MGSTDVSDDFLAGPVGVAVAAGALERGAVELEACCDELNVPGSASKNGENWLFVRRGYATGVVEKHALDELATAHAFLVVFRIDIE